MRVERSVRPRSAVIALSLAAAGCTVGPQYRRPAVSVDPAWSGPNDPRLAPQAVVDQTSWRSFNDPALDRLLENALAQNIPLQIAGSRIREARAELGMTRAEYYPVHRNPAAGTSAGAIVPFSGAGPISCAGYQLRFDAAWEPDFWGRVRRGTRVANAAYLATIADYEGALVPLIAEVARLNAIARRLAHVPYQALSREQIKLPKRRVGDAREMPLPFIEEKY